MLLHQPETPPIATPHPKTGPNMGAWGWTYAGEMSLREYHGRFGRNLCELVRDCCMHMNADRPSLGQLRARVAAGVAANPLTNDDINWVRRTLNTPRNPPQVVPQPGAQPAGAWAAMPF